MLQTVYRQYWKQEFVLNVANKVPQFYSYASLPCPSSLTWKHWQLLLLGHQTSVHFGFACWGYYSLLPTVEDSVKKTATKEAHFIRGSETFVPNPLCPQLTIKMSKWEWNHKGYFLNSPDQCMVLDEAQTASRPVHGPGWKTRKGMTTSNDRWFQLPSQDKINNFLQFFLLFLVS